MTRREAAKQLVELYAEAKLKGLQDDGTSAEVVALAVGALLKDGEDDVVIAAALAMAREAEKDDLP